MDTTMQAAVDRLRADARSGASELVPQAIEILREAIARAPGEVADVARAVGEAQPSMASLWNAAIAALSEPEQPGAIDRFEQRWRRAGRAMARAALDTLVPVGGGPAHIVTCSFSGSVVACLRELRARAAVRVSCAEGRPALEGRRLAEVLSDDGIPVAFFTDAAIAEALAPGPGAPAVVLVGADAVTPDAVVNKAGTGMLAAAAARAGAAVYVAATRDKFTDARVARLLRIVAHDPSEVWGDPPPGVTVRNAYFERVPIDLVSGVITDAGTLWGDMVGEACRASSALAADRHVGQLLATRPSAP